ncbi:hypothetical protein D3C72_2174390 [compost metagenome]
MVACVQCQVVQHAPPGGHAAGRQDDHGAMKLGQPLGLLGRLDHGGAMLQCLHLAAAQAVFLHVVLEQPRGTDGHGAVQKHLERCGHHTLRLE